MKSKPAVIIVIVAATALILGAGIWYFNSPAYHAARLQTVQSRPAMPDFKTLDEINASSRPLKCGFGGAGDKGSMVGTFYVAHGQARADYADRNDQGVQTLNRHLIMNGGTVQAWSDGQTAGTQMPVTQFRDFDLGQKFPYDCQPWTYDSALFAPPAGVTFSATPTAP